MYPLASLEYVAGEYRRGGIWNGFFPIGAAARVWDNPQAVPSVGAWVVRRMLRGGGTDPPILSCGEVTGYCG